MFNTFSPMDSSISLSSTSQTPSLLNIPQSLSPSTQSTQTSFFSPSFTNIFSTNSFSFIPKFNNQNHYQNHHHHHNSNHVHNNHNNDNNDHDQCDKSKSRLDVKLVEPVIFFRGKPEEAVGCILRGDLVLHLSQPTKIKKLQLKFIGKTKTILDSDRKTVASEKELISKTWNFLPSEDDEISNEGSFSPTSPISPRSSIQQQQSPIQQREQQERRDLRLKFFKTSLLRKSNNNNNNNNNNNKMHIKKLPAGIHTYPFELFLPGDLPETVNTELGKVSYCLYAQASRSRFTPKIKYRQNVEILRTIPEHVNAEGIGFAREFNNMLSYEISIPKKSYPIGQNIPIEMKICPYVKKLRVNGVRVELIEKTTYISKNDRKVSVSKTGTTQELNEFGESRLIEDYEEGDVGNTVYQQNMNLILPKCPSPIHYSCDTPLVSVSHDLKFSFALTLPYSPSKRAELKINIPITILSCRALEDYIGLPSYEDSFHCPCDPEYLRMARLVLGENAREILLNNNYKFVIENYDNDDNDHNNNGHDNNNSHDTNSHHSRHSRNNSHDSHHSYHGHHSRNNSHNNISHHSRSSSHDNISHHSRNDSVNNNNNNINFLNIPGNLYVDRLLYNRSPPSYEASIAESCDSRNLA
ncbi:hypothetical protein Glove_144g25 [Diversispora epigaea]|uniref:Arrestin C-terminal-like domain-containing protein n=1 Tax=Diversispora epigaea TaxID=1348612 RepID=A0A397J0K9_9GLOM|nr:hypothetical protein Glove_144g25 [Diversispora epigaea]